MESVFYFNFRFMSGTRKRERMGGREVAGDRERYKEIQRGRERYGGGEGRL